MSWVGFTAYQHYFTNFELSQSLGDAKKGYPREKPPTDNLAGLICGRFEP